MSAVDTLLSELCSNCRMNPPKYKCPGCFRLNCSLACVKQHKRRVPCSGVRGIQPVSLKELYTDAGINNDYNFITGIERGIERAERIVIEERKLIPKRRDRALDALPHSVKRKRLEYDRNMRIFDTNDTEARNRTNRERRIAEAARRCGVFIKKAPDEMQRHKDNQSAMAGRNMNWQIEWVADDGTHTLHKLNESTPLGSAYELILNEQIRVNMNKKQVNAAKRRKDKKTKRGNSARKQTTTISSYLQNPKNSCWNVQYKTILPGHIIELPAKEQPANLESPYHFYLLRPFTPSNRPKVLVPLDSAKPISQQLRNQVVFEFPTIYVSEREPKEMAKSFEIDDMNRVQKDKSKDKKKDQVKGKGKGKGLVDYSDTESESNSAPSSDSDSDSQSEEEDDDEPTSSEGSDESVDGKEDDSTISWSSSSEEESGDDDGDALMEDT